MSRDPTSQTLLSRNTQHATRKSLLITLVKLFVLFCLAQIAAAQTTFTVTSSADAFLATGSPDNPVGTNLTDENFGGAGQLVIAPASGVKGEFQTIIQFDLNGETNLFDSTYGTNNWTITAIMLDLASNNGGQGEQPKNLIFPAVNGGAFVVEWLSDNNWSEGTGTPALPTMDGVTYESLPELLASQHAIISTNTYVPPGDNIRETYSLPLQTNLLTNIMGGGLVTLLLYAGDSNVSYLFNTHSFGNGDQPFIHITAVLANSTLIQPQILNASFTNGTFQFTAVAEPNTQYQIQTSSNLATTNWQFLANANSDTNGQIQFTDPTASNQPTRFYRLHR